MDKQPEIKMPCPECGWELVIRTNRKTGEEFLACSKYPECRYTQPLTPYLIAKRSGHPTLF